MTTLLLDVSTWDLCLDASGNIAVAARPYALAQDVASAVRTFLAEVWYDDTLGVPYLEQILGQQPVFALFQAAVVQAALTVPGVVSAVCQVTDFATREITGQVLFTDDSGAQHTVSLT